MSHPSHHTGSLQREREEKEKGEGEKGEKTIVGSENGEGNAGSGELEEKPTAGNEPPKLETAKVEQLPQPE
jgi:hypothetical protein